MRKGRIKVEVEEGSFPSERSISFKVGDKRYSLLVDKEDIQEGNTLEVAVVDVNEKENQALIDLPRDTFSSGNRIFVPTNLLLAL